ncbi:MAG: hypothetical protein FWH27_09560 [Planctomycetaceae bacterium]|nr:hypothetical protein [Planctomycetaceae bacterium]
MTSDEWLVAGHLEEAQPTIHDSLPATHHLPLTTNHSPLAARHSSLATDHSPATGIVSLEEFIAIVGEDAVAEAFLQAQRAELNAECRAQSAECEIDETAGMTETDTSFRSASHILRSAFCTLHSAFRHLWILTLAWLTGVTFLSARLAGGLFGIRQLRRSGKPAALCGFECDWDSRLAALCRRLRIGRNVPLLVSRAIDSPVLIGIFRPVVLVPMSFLSGFTPEEVEAILVHELAHVRRHDYLANLVQLLMETLLFYHPLFWYVSRAVHEDREYLCDEFVVQRHGTDSLFYAKTLSRLEQFRQTKGTDMKRMMTTPAAAAKPLLNRIRRILGLKNESNRTCRGVAGMTLLAILMLTPLVFALLQDQNLEFRNQSEEVSAEIGNENEQIKSENEQIKSGTIQILSEPIQILSGNEQTKSEPTQTKSENEQIKPGTMQILSEPMQIKSENGQSQPSGAEINMSTFVTNVPAQRDHSAPAVKSAQSDTQSLSLTDPTARDPQAQSHSIQQAQSHSIQTESTPHSPRLNPDLASSFARQIPNPPEPVAGKLYPTGNAMQLFEMQEFMVYLRERVPSCVVTTTRRDAVIVTGTEEVHEQMKQIMAEIDAIVASEEFQATREMNAEPEQSIKVFQVRHTQAAMLINIFNSLQMEQMLMTADMRTNTLIIKASNERLADVEELLKKLDTEPFERPSRGPLYSVPAPMMPPPQPGNPYPVASGYGVPHTGPSPMQPQPYPPAGVFFAPAPVQPQPTPEAGTTNPADAQPSSPWIQTIPPVQNPPVQVTPPQALPQPQYQPPGPSVPQPQSQIQSQSNTQWLHQPLQALPNVLPQAEAERQPAWRFTTQPPPSSGGTQNPTVATPDARFQDMGGVLTNNLPGQPLTGILTQQPAPVSPTPLPPEGVTVVAIPVTGPDGTTTTMEFHLFQEEQNGEIIYRVDVETPEPTPTQPATAECEE